MIESITAATLKFLELAPRYLAVIAVVSGITLFASDGLLEFLGIKELAENNRQWIGGAFLVSVTIVGVSALIACKEWISTKRKRKRNGKRFKEHLDKRLKSLTEDEKQILRFYIYYQTRSNTLKIDDGIVNGLVADGIIYRAASLGNMLEGFSHNISDRAWERLNENPSLLDGVTNEYRTDKWTGFGF